jgi:hypothetical protein
MLFLLSEGKKACINARLKEMFKIILYDVLERLGYL